MATPETEVYFDYDLEGEDGSTESVSVCATISAYTPATFNSVPGCPAEGGEVEEITVARGDGTELDPIPPRLYDELVEIALAKAETET